MGGEVRGNDLDPHRKQLFELLRHIL
jgi:hypothetical protein